MSGLPKVPVTWPLSGGLDGAKNPLSVVPGTHLLLDNAIQERIDEWRTRQGFTQANADTVASGKFFHFSATGDNGLFGASAFEQDVYRGSLTSNRWTARSVQPAQTASRVSVLMSTTQPTALAAAGNLRLVAHASAFTVYDTVAKTQKYQNFAAYLRVRGAATAAHLVLFAADGSGNLITYVIDATTGAVTGPTTIKTGLHTTQPYLDAIWYGGSTITVVARTSGDLVRFIEFNPATGALATDTTVAGVSCANCLALFHDPDASGTRFVALSHTTPTTRVVRCSSAGAVLTDSQVEAIASTQIAGMAFNAGVDWSVIYRTSTPNLKCNERVGGVVGSPTNVQNNTWGSEAFLESQAWRDTTDSSNYRLLLGLHTLDASNDAQDTWVECQFGFGGAGIFNPTYAPAQLQAASAVAQSASLFQVIRTGVRTFDMALPVLSKYAREGASVTRTYSVDIFTETLLTEAEIGAVNMGPPAVLNGQVYFPGLGLSFPDQGWMQPIGTRQIPRKLSLTASSGGALTPSKTYFYRAHFEIYDGYGNVWRSRPSAAVSVLLGPSDNRVIVAWSCPWRIEERSTDLRLVISRTNADGTAYRRVTTVSCGTGGGNSSSFNDDVADSVLGGASGGGELLYTTGELPTSPTPMSIHQTTWGDRLWSVNADYRTELWSTKRLRPGRTPEFIDAGVLDLDDAYGDITGLAPLVERLVVFKRNAVYFVVGDGLEDSGAGQLHQVAKVAEGIGALPGTPVIPAGDSVYFVSERGVQSIDRGGNVTWIGKDIDNWLHQPQINTPETVYDGVFIPERNEVRLVTTNYILVHNRNWGTWTRWTGLAGMKRAVVMAGRMVTMKASDGTLWREGDHTQLTDQGAAIAGKVRSAWVRANEGQMRLYKGGVIMTRTAGGGTVSPVLNIYYDHDDSTVETFTPSPAIPGSQLLIDGTAQPRRHRCKAFSLEAVLPSGDKTVRLARWFALIGPKKGSKNLGASNRWA